MRRVIYSLFSLLGLLSCTAFAFRTAPYDPVLRPRVAVWLDQDRILNTENANDKNRPIWVQSGDSLASSWSNQVTLRERLAQAQSKTIPMPGTMDDMQDNIPSYRFTWFAGSDFGFGFLGALEHSTEQQWVVISTALAGARMSVVNGEDPLSLPLSVKQPERVKLFTMSLGGNDICQGRDPMAAKENSAAKMDSLNQKFPNARKIVWKVPPLLNIRTAVFAALNALPPSPARDQMLTYCKASWDNWFCAPANTQSDWTASKSAEINTLLETKFGTLYDPYEALVGMSPLDLMSQDCFHPSRLSEQKISEDLARKYLKP